MIAAVCHGIPHPFTRNVNIRHIGHAENSSRKHGLIKNVGQLFWPEPYAIERGFDPFSADAIRDRSSCCAKA